MGCTAASQPPKAVQLQRSHWLCCLLAARLPRAYVATCTKLALCHEMMPPDRIAPDHACRLKKASAWHAELGQGAFGKVQLAVNIATGEQVAIKFVERGHGITKFVAREVMNHSKLLHPHIVQFKEVWHRQCCRSLLRLACSSPAVPGPAFKMRLAGLGPGIVTLLSSNR